MESRLSSRLGLSTIGGVSGAWTGARPKRGGGEDLVHVVVPGDEPDRCAVRQLDESGRPGHRGIHLVQGDGTDDGTAFLLAPAALTARTAGHISHPPNDKPLFQVIR